MAGGCALHELDPGPVFIGAHPITREDFEGLSMPWSPGLREYEAHTWAEIVEGVGELPS